MSSTATRNARSDSVRRGRGRPRGSVRKIQFTLVHEDIIHAVTLDENEPVSALGKKVESLFKIPIHKQFIYGWPCEEPRHDQVLKDLELEPEVLLQIAVVGFLEPSDGLPESDEDGARPGTSRDPNSSQASSSRLPSRSQPERQTYNLRVKDMKNGESYDEIMFQGHDCVYSVKRRFAELTTIPIEYQEWSGWPDCVTARSGDERILFLRDIDLDIPYHSLVLNDLRLPAELESSNVVASVSQSEIEIDNETSSSSSSNKVMTEKNKSDAPPKKKGLTARKSTSKAPLRDLINKRNSKNVNANGHNDSQRDVLDSTVEELPSSRSWDDSALTPCVASTSTASGTPNYSQALDGPSTPKKFKLGDELSPSKSPRRQRGPSPLLALEEKIYNNILNCLKSDPKSYLSLRRVCKKTKEWIWNRQYNALDEELWRKFSLTITGFDMKTFETAASMNLPITRFVFDVDGEEFYDRQDVESFINLCSLRVKDVTLRKFYMFQSPGERNIFESFHGLEKLTIDNLVILNTSTVLPCPRSIANLQILKLNYEISIPEDNVLIRPKCWDMTWSMLSDCDSLLYFRFPRANEDRLNSNRNDLDIFAPLLDYINRRVRSGGVALEYLDLKHYNNPESYYINRFVDLLRRCYRKDIKLKNIQSLVIRQVFDEDGAMSDDKYKFCENIVSLINYSPFVENAPLSNLEKITVDVIPSVTDYATLGRGYKDIFWPKLRTIKIKDSIQQNRTRELWSCWQEVQEDLYGHGQDGLFDRGLVQYIKIDSPKLPYFLSEGRLSEKFYNLKRLEIVSWCGTDAVFSKRMHAIWRKLRLEELRIENCTPLNDYSFIEEEDDNESSDNFHRLTPTLKKITLGLDGTGVTDKSLIKVFSRMQFKIFILRSTTPTKISEAGLLKLHQREFGKYIEYFPFDCWTSASIDQRRFERLGKKFRSIR